MQMPRRCLIDDFITSTKAVHSKERLYELLIEAVTALGFDLLNVSVVYDPELAEEHWGVGLINTYPAHWQKRYLDRKYAQIDPVLRRASGRSLPFWWRDIARQGTLNSEQRALLRDVEAAGLFNGVGVPFRGPTVLKAGLALATSSCRLDRPVDLDIAAVIGNRFYDVYKRICGVRPQLPIQACLSRRETEILVRAAHGRTDTEIMKGLGITYPTVRYHWGSIFKKLGASSRAQAVGYAVRDGVIEL